MPRILSVSYDAMLLSTRQMMLESHGYTVTSAEGFVDAIRMCRGGNYDLLIIGHSIPHTDKGTKKPLWPRCYSIAPRLCWHC